MLDDGVRVHCSVPGTRGITETLLRLVNVGSVVTAYDDALLRTVKSCGLPEGAEIVPFSELVGRFSRMWGVEGKAQATTGQRQAIAARAMARSPEESFLHASAAFPGSAEKLVEVVRELEHSGFDADTLDALSDSLDPDHARRLRDVVAVMRTQDESLTALNRETPLRRIERCMERAETLACPIKKVVCLAHGEHAPVYDRFISWLSTRGVTVDLVDEPAWPGLFWAAQERHGEAGSDHWTRSVFTDSAAPAPVDFAAFRAADPLSECEWVIRRCLAARKEGYADTDIAILARDGETYAPLLLSTALRLGVPLSASWTQPLLANGLAHTVLASVKALAGSDVRAIGRLARCSLLSPQGLSTATLWEVLKQCYSTGDEQWTELTSRCSDLTDWPWLEPLMEWRRTAIEEPANLSAWAGRLRLLGAVLDNPSPRTDDRDKRAQNLMQRSLLDVASIRPEDERLTLSQFVRLAEPVWEGQRVTVDDRKGGVWVGQSAHSLPPVSVLFVLGMVEGAMPRRRTQEPVLGDGLRKAINQLVGNKGRVATSYGRASEERDEFLRVCATPSDQIVFSYPESSGDSPSTPSYFLRAIARMKGQTLDQMVEVIPRTQWIPPREECLAMQDLKMAQAADDPPYLASDLVLTDRDMAADMRLDPDQGVDLRQLGDYSECPFRATVRHRLGLFASHPPNPLYRLVDLPTRAGLATSPTEHEAESRLHHALGQKLSALYSELDPWEAQLLKVAGERLIQSWVTREFAARKTWPRSEWTFEGFPVQALRLGEGGTRATVSIGGGQQVLVKTDPLPVYQVGPFLVARWVEASLSDPGQAVGDEEESGYEGSAKWLRHGILLGFLSKTGYPVGLEVETLGTRRWMLILAKGDETVFQNKGSNLERRAMQHIFPEYIKDVSDRAREVVKEMLAGNIDVRPGTPCRACDYGGLCRRSSAILGDDQ